MGTSKKKAFRPFSERNYAVPFGRYQPGGEVGPPENEVLVGREGQRAYFIDLLFRMGRRGAFLVTGHRGVGKTSFVRHCLTTYKDEVFERFLNSNVGRATFWDRLGIMALGLASLFVLSMLHQLIEIFTLPLVSNQPPGPIVWVLLVPLIVICLYPMLYAREVLRRVFEVIRRNGWRFWDYNANIYSVIAAAFLTAFIWFCPPFGSPSLSMSRLLVVIGTVYLWVQCLSFNFKKIANYGRIAKMVDRLPFWWPLLFLALLLLAVLFGILPSWWWEKRSHEVFGNFSLALCVLGLGSLLRGLHLRRCSRYRAEGSVEVALSKTSLIPEPASWYLWSGGAFFALGAIIFSWHQPGTGFAVAATLVLTSSATFWSVQLFLRKFGGKAKDSYTGRVSFRPRSSLVLFVKAVLCIVVTLQLLHPFIVRGAHWLLIDPGIPVLASIGMTVAPPSSEPKQWKGGGLVLREIPGSTNQKVFPSQTEEISWIAALFLSLLVIYYLEYEWIVRPFVHKRSDPNADESPWGDQIPEWEAGGDGYKSLAKVTLPWVLYKAWLPVLTISVNLGFERLDHRRVVHAMLAGLREKYQRSFLSWSSGFANLLRLLGVLLIMIMVNLIGQHWFEMQPLSAGQLKEARQNGYENVCSLYKGVQIGPTVANIICKLPGGNTLFHVLYFNILESDRGRIEIEEHLLLNLLLPYREHEWPLRSPSIPFLDSQQPDITRLLSIYEITPSITRSQGEELEAFFEEGIHLEIYHVLLFMALYVLGRWLLGKLPLLPYRETLRRIDEVMDFLSARTSVTSRTNRWEPIQVLQGWLMDERVRQTEQDPVDPRTVEFQFLQILQDIQSASLHLAGARDQLVSLPTPEVIFIFDELDKLGTRVDPGERESSGGIQQAEILHAERKRSMELHKLLADMKNLLSSAPARFIFIGGRNLHDEWLADQSARQPLLTNIFNAEVYLPSLVTDLGRIELCDRSLSRNIRVYLETQIDRAKALYYASRNKLSLPSLALPIEDAGEETFVPWSAEREPKMHHFDLYPSDAGPLGEFIEKEEHLPKLLFRDFYQYLTYRSMGNPKRLKEVLGTFIRPVYRAVKDENLRWTAFRDCDHVLSFGDIERFRVQLLSRIYRHLTLTFEHRLVRRDDKLAISVFFLADFLFKFHSRAFSWSNLERVDELVHIHRAPDLREILKAMVIRWSERFLHPIRNGMYDFRFRSDLAREVEYISRQSHEEMAAFNFTLDESQALKAAYIVNIAQFKDKIGHEPVDMVAGLGELHEFDQEYEDARVYYQRAIRLLDEELEQLAGWKEEEVENGEQGWRRSPMLEIMASTRAGQELARLHMTWGIARLRLMLQVGMTFELSRNLERAGVEYRNAHTLARALLSAMLRDEEASSSDDRLHALKHLNILFQPAFAEAWVAEKLAGSVDTSISLIEKELLQLRSILPFVQDLHLRLSPAPAEVRGSNFALIIAELQNKAGDLYFFKGRQKITIRDLREMSKQERGREDIKNRYEGYLLRAHYHYSLALHDLRRFVTHRRYSSRYKLNDWSETIFTKRWPTISRENWPDFIYRSAGGSLNDLGEAMLGRVSLYGLLRDLANLPLGVPQVDWDSVEKAKIQITQGFIDWMETARHEGIDGDNGEEKEPLAVFIPIGDASLSAGTMESWFGEWTLTRGASGTSEGLPLIEFKDIVGHSDATRLALSLQLKLVGSKMLEKGGYIEDAAHELLGLCEVVTSYLWWFLAIQELSRCKLDDQGALPLVQEAFNKANAACLSSYAAQLVQVALYSLGKADRLFRRGRRAEEEEDCFKAKGESRSPFEYLAGNKVPIVELIDICSLGLAALGLGLGKHISVGLPKLLQSLGVSLKEDTEGGLQDGLRDLLKQTLVRHSYPMIGRLEGLKILIDDLILNQQECSVEEIDAWTAELLKLTSDLDARMHFTPLHSGVTYAMAYFRLLTLKSKDPECERNAATLEIVQRAAQRDLATSEEMFTLRWSYYENIANLAYLYDDFNDRQIHIRHAIQMAGAELNALLMYLVTGADYPNSTLSHSR